MALLLLLFLLIVSVVTYALTRPDTFSVSRSVRIAATPDKVFPLIDNLKAMNSWNPFAADPAIKLTYTGPESGRGAVQTWDSTGRPNKGRIEIVDSTAASKIVMDMAMEKPFAGRNTITFMLVPIGGGTDVSWRMDGTLAFLPKLLGLFMSTDKMMGRMFEKGLADLKTKAETPVIH